MIGLCAEPKAFLKFKKNRARMLQYKNEPPQESFRVRYLREEELKRVEAGKDEARKKGLEYGVDTDS